MTAYTQRVEVGAYYTDGATLVEITEVNPLGYVEYRDTQTEEPGGKGIDAFRRIFWLAAGPASPSSRLSEEDSRGDHD